MAATEGVRTEESYNFLIVESHSVENVPNVLDGGLAATLVCVGEATICVMFGCVPYVRY